jgi:hypothetical protein
MESQGFREDYRAGFRWPLKSLMMTLVDSPYQMSIGFGQLHGIWRLPMRLSGAWCRRR